MPVAARAQPPVPLAPVTQSGEDPVREQRLAQMKRRATGLLVVATLVFVAARLLEPAYPWLGFVRATAEAAMVGGVADWFAVTALFRHPLGIPIPHTAIIAHRKDRIGRTLGGFVQANFLSREVVASRLESLNIAERLAGWISQPQNSHRIAQHVARAMSAGAEVIRDDEVQALIERGMVNRVRKTQFAPLIGNVLALMTADNRHQELLDEALRLISRAVSENEDAIRDKIREESPWWIPERVDDKIHEKVVDSLERTLREVSTDPHHALRARFDTALHGFIERLRTSPEAIARVEQLKEEMLTHPAVQQFSASVWRDVKQSLLDRAERGESATPGAVEQGLVTLGNAMRNDPRLLEKVNGWIVDAALYVVEQYRHEVGQLISDTVGRWDPDATSRKIELAIGRDLQFIRINGTIIGGLVGLLLYTFSVLL
ncbi:MAG TPA: DUF445 family protein [Gemmatimonadaceae bacterium]|nr:DUF445 family protein [Gemmatimonadaceae bacterium]